jgi:hypothetical protein
MMPLGIVYKLDEVKVFTMMPLGIVYKLDEKKATILLKGCDFL